MEIVEEMEFDKAAPTIRDGESEEELRARKAEYDRIQLQKDMEKIQIDDGLLRLAYLVGRCFLHPVTKRIYEIVSVYWNSRAKLFAAYRQLADEGPTILEDRYFLPVEGKLRRAGDLNMQYEWPQSEEEWLSIQKRDPECVELL